LKIYSNQFLDHIGDHTENKKDKDQGDGCFQVIVHRTYFMSSTVVYTMTGACGIGSAYRYQKQPFIVINDKVSYSKRSSKSKNLAEQLWAAEKLIYRLVAVYAMLFVFLNNCCQ
jgi:hypothetical protein